MALGTYSDLKASIATWLRRSDMTAVIPDLITLAERTMNRELKTSFQLVEAPFTIDAEFVDKPAGFMQMRALRLTQVGVVGPLDEWTVEQMSAAKATPAVLVSYPRRWSAIGSQFEFWPVPAGSYSAVITYQQGFTPLSDANPSNWILADHPDAYLYGSLTAGSAYAKNFDNAEVWKGEFTRVMDEIQQALRSSYDRKLRVDPALQRRPRDRTFNYLTGDD
jgi:hypothetical protein